MNPNLGRKLRHLSMRTMKKLKSRKPVGRLPKIIIQENKVCKACYAMGKQTRSSFKLKNFVSTLDLLNYCILTYMVKLELQKVKYMLC